MTFVHRLLSNLGKKANPSDHINSDSTEETTIIHRLLQNLSQFSINGGKKDLLPWCLSGILEGCF